MGLKSSIVIVSEYSVKGVSGKGSRGSTPGDYVLRYMSRDGASERIAPVRLDTEDFILRYMARDEACEAAGSAREAEDALFRVGRHGGVAFGDGKYSLSDRELRKKSEALQGAFDSGKTVIKTVLSFTEDYLRENGCLPEGFSYGKRGDYRGHIDQLKLRAAISRGMGLMSRHYDDLRYVGVIQVDTAHVHCHLAMADFGRGHVMPDGTQRGKILEPMKRDLRHGIDLGLSLTHPLRTMASCIAMDKRNAVAFVKRSAYRAVTERGFLQVLGAALPSDRGLWRAGSARCEMRRPNALVRSFVEGALSDMRSGFKEARGRIREYARERAMREDLSRKEERRFSRDGEEGLIRKCMDGVYSVLKKVPSREWSVKTPMLSVFSTDYEVVRKLPREDPLLEFGYKLRTYRARLSHHKGERDRYRGAVEAYDRQGDKSDASRAVRDFFSVEAEYQAMLASKYQSLMGFLPLRRDLREEWEESRRKRKRLSAMRDAWKDTAPRMMLPAEADLYVREAYGVEGGHYLSSSPAEFSRLIDESARDVLEGERALGRKLLDEGFSMEGDHVARKAAFPFDEVKALDLHHLGYDFNGDFRVPAAQAEKFVACARRRASAYAKAVKYLEATGQGEAVKVLPGADVRAQASLAVGIMESPVFRSRKRERGRLNDGHTVSLSGDYLPALTEAVRETALEASRGPEL